MRKSSGAEKRLGLRFHWLPALPLAACATAWLAAKKSRSRGKSVGSSVSYGFSRFSLWIGIDPTLDGNRGASR